jgi:hypothetical protein
MRTAMVFKDRFWLMDASPPLGVTSVIEIGGKVFRMA